MTNYILPFEKMHGLGNDFILLEKRHLPTVIDLGKLAKSLCNRNFSIGADGIIVVDLSPTKDSDFSWDYLNSDGSEAEMCGNGMRCFVKYVFERGFSDKKSISVLTKAGIILSTIEGDGSVTVNMGRVKIPEVLVEQIDVGLKVLDFTYIEIGNPHCIIFLNKEISDSDFYQLGPQIEKHHKFPNGINVEFVKIINRGEIITRVWERGAGPTLACGTGACAVLAASNLNNFTNNKAKVYLPGGCLLVNWDKQNNQIFLNGPASSVFIGQINIKLSNFY